MASFGREGGYSLTAVSLWLLSDEEENGREEKAEGFFITEDDP